MAKAEGEGLGGGAGENVEEGGRKGEERRR